ncbi:MAG: hypothetical protein L0H79_04495 [Intrasporangium sp.]|uniref:DUF6541 family protein n=1 Tax=Intrasporangium sp. TaxID=1925024 RepID=UPI00264A1E6A|nr:DUF6541 family protein [Intrasporangium sp.]MDN5794992.1 hypothetical protein [Intrasporangium sp.]
MTSWAQTIPVFVVFVALAFVPGWLVVRAFGSRGVEAVAISPAVSVGVLAGFGTAAGVLGVRWTWWVVIASTALSVVAAWLVGGWLARSRGGRDPELHLKRRLFGRPRPDVVIACLVGVVLALVTILPAFGRPDSLVDSPDAVYHLNRIRTFIESGDVSLFNPAFYPNGFHAWVATGLMAFGTPVLAGTNVATLVVAAVVWPVGCVALVRHALGTSLLVTYAAGFASAAFLSFPTTLLGWGVLWPNLMGTAMLPAALALMLQAARTRHPGKVLTFCVSLPGLALVHPNVIVSLVVFILVWFATARLRAGVLRHLPWRVVVRDVGIVAALVVAGIVLAPLLSPRLAATQAYTWSGQVSVWAALTEVVGGRLMVFSVLWGLLALIVLGIAWVLWRARQAIPIVAMWLTCVALYVMAASSSQGWTALVTGYWYNDKVRLAALAAVPGVVLVAGAAPMVRLLLHRTRWVQTWNRREPLLAAGVALALIPALTVGLHASTRYQLLHNFFSPGEADRVILSDQGRASLAQLADRIPAGEGVVGRPENGSPLMWALFGTNTLYRSIPITGSGDNVLLGTGFADMQRRPDVCAALARNNIRWAIGSSHTYWLDRPALTSGLMNLDRVDGLEKVETVGQYTLYRITGCRLG